MSNLLDLNEYALEQVLYFLSEKDLVNLSMVNSVLYARVQCYLRPIVNKKLMVCGQQRSPQIFTSINLLKVHRNWLDGRYLERITFKHKPLFFCHIQLEERLLTKSFGSEIRTYKRDSDGYLNERPQMFIDAKQQADITYFVKRDDRIFAGLSNGTCLLYNTTDNSRLDERCYSDCEFITCVDCKDDIFVTTGKKRAKVFRLESELGLQALEMMYELPVVFQSCRLHSSRNLLALGKYSDREKRALCMVDLETGIVQEQDSYTGAIYDMLWKDENCVLTANFDSTLRLTDIRTKKDELIFTDIYNSSVYCLDFDGQYGVVCGMKYFRVNLYDIRVAKRFTQMYFPKRTSFNNSPVYSIQCDSSQLYVQTDTNLRILNFNCDYEKCRDYSNMNIYN